MPPIIDKEQCLGCGVCADICQMQVFYRDTTVSKIPVVRYPDECWHCNACHLDCPTGAVTLRFPLPFMLLHVDATTLKDRS